jgi:hypothetical protein
MRTHLTLWCADAGNLALLLFRCGSDFYVKLLYNEREMLIPGCGDDLYCPWSTFFSLHKAVLDYNLTAECAMPLPLVPSASAGDELVLDGVTDWPLIIVIVVGLLVLVVSLLCYRKCKRKAEYGLPTAREHQDLNGHVVSPTTKI